MTFKRPFLEYTVNDRERLKDETFVGQIVSFEVKTVDNILKRTYIKSVKGKITEKYPYIFRMDDGKVYTWTDYLLGYKS